MESCTIESFNLLRWYFLKCIKLSCYHKNTENIIRRCINRKPGSIGVILTCESYLHIWIILKLWIPEHDKITVFFWAEIHRSKCGVEKLSYLRSFYDKSMRHIVWNGRKILSLPEESIHLLSRSFVLYDTLRRSLNRPTFFERRIFWESRCKFTIIV